LKKMRISYLRKSMVRLLSVRIFQIKLKKTGVIVWTVFSINNKF
jgi:hypothetical protein